MSRLPEGSARTLPAARYFRFDPMRVVHETIQGETILIDLQTGTYFSLTGSGPDVWTMLAAGNSDAQVVEQMRVRAPADPDRAAELTHELITQLHAKGLLEETAAPEALNQDPGPSSDAPFTAPVLEEFTDMQPFLVLDPIHEVADAGWPYLPVKPQG